MDGTKVSSETHLTSVSIEYFLLDPLFGGESRCSIDGYAGRILIDPLHFFPLRYQ